MTFAFIRLLEECMISPKVSKNRTLIMDYVVLGTD